MRPGNWSNPGNDGMFGVEKCPVATMTLSNCSVRLGPLSRGATVIANFPAAGS